MYIKRVRVQNKRSLLGGVLGAFGGFSSDDQCSTIPIGDPYRKPGNYCATPDGGVTTFNSNGSTYREPGAVDPDPAHPAGSGSSGILDSILRFLPGQQPTVIAPQPSTGLSTTTALAIGGGIIVLALVLKKRG